MHKKLWKHLHQNYSSAGMNKNIILKHLLCHEIKVRNGFTHSEDNNYCTSYYIFNQFYAIRVNKCLRHCFLRLEKENENLNMIKKIALIADREDIHNSSCEKLLV